MRIVLNRNLEVLLRISKHKVVAGGMRKKVASLLCLALLLPFVGCSDTKGKISEIDRSPSGRYQIDEVNWSGGATAGESYLVIETSDGNAFAGEGGTEPDSGLMIKETRFSYNTDYKVSWVSESSFVAEWASPQSDNFNIARVDLTDDGYTIFCGSVQLVREESYLSGFEVVDDEVYFTCNLRITNESSEDVRFTLDARAANEDVGQLLADGDLVAVNDDGQPMVFEIAAVSSEMFTVIFRGGKGPSDTKADRELPPWIYLYYYEI